MNYCARVQLSKYFTSTKDFCNFTNLFKINRNCCFSTGFSGVLLNRQLFVVNIVRKSNFTIFQKHLRGGLQKDLFQIPFFKMFQDVSVQCSSKSEEDHPFVMPHVETEFFDEDNDNTREKYSRNPISIIIKTDFNNVINEVAKVEITKTISKGIKKHLEEFNIKKTIFGIR